MDTRTKQVVSKLPPTWHTCSATHEQTLAIGTQSGQVLIINFPSSVFTSSETRYIEGKSWLVDTSEGHSE